jgi:thiamine pyrophosphate-dependent acetolactate synthase large subunit-like protein
VIAAGKGVMRRQAMRELSDLSLKLQAPVVCAQDAIGVIPEHHPFFAGYFAHNRAHPLSAQALGGADVVLGIGLRAGTAELTELRERARENMILIGFDDVAEARYRGENECVADPKLFLNALLDRLRDRERPRNEPLIARLAEGKAAIRRKLAEHNAPHQRDKPIHPGLLMDAMNAVLSDDAVVASDVGNCQQWARTFRRISNPESFMQSGVWNAMSYALPTAIVAKMEYPERDVVALAGDGAFLMTIGDLPTATEYGANVLMIVLNDGAFGQTLMQQTNIYGHIYGTSFRSPNFAEIAQSCGAKGIRVTEPDEVESVLREGLAATKTTPALVEVMVADSPYPKL